MGSVFPGRGTSWMLNSPASSFSRLLALACNAFLRFYELLVQYRVLALSDDLGQAGQCAHIGMIVGNRRIGFHQEGNFGIIVHIGNITVILDRNGRQYGLRHFRPLGIPPKYFQQA